MNEPRHDDERLAALLEGRLDGPERDELLAYLAAADEDFHVFAKTAAALREMEEEEKETAATTRQTPGRVDHLLVRTTTLQPSARSGWRRWKAPLAIVPAVLAGLVVLGILMTRGGDSTSAGDPIQLAASLDQPLPKDWNSTLPVATRGEASSVSNAQAMHAGALLVDLALAVETQDASNTRLLARILRERYYDRAVPGSAILQIEERAGEPDSVLLPLLEQAKEKLKGKLPEEQTRAYLELGAWGEAARLAAHYGNTGFFRSETTGTMLDRAEELTRGNAAAHDAVGRIRGAVSADAMPDVATLDNLLTELMNAVAS